jgi:hypothetical protein
MDIPGPSAGAPVDTPRNSTITAGWVSSPNERGTFSLITSCLLTLGLCVWSAMHINIPPYGESSIQYWIRNGKWALVGFLGPELVVFAAWRQYNSAKALLVELRAAESSSRPILETWGWRKVEVLPNASTLWTEFACLHLQRLTAQDNPQRIDAASRWTMTHGFYAGMGGFTIEFDNSIIPECASFIPSRRRLTLTPRGIVLLARCGLLPDISKEEITDKSKADSIAKSIACLQATWFTIQIIARLVLKLPVTLLEVNTLGHVFAAFVIYVLWWHKPRMISEPTKLTGPWTGPLGAYMYMSSQISGQKCSRKGLLRRPWAEPELSKVLYLPHPSGRLIKDNKELSNGDIVRHREQLDALAGSVQGASKSPNGSIIATNPTSLAGHRQSKQFTPGNDDALDLSGTMLQDDNFGDSMESRRWRQAVEAMESYPAIASRYISKGFFEKADIRCEWIKPSTEQLVIRFAGNWPTDDLLRGVGGLLMGMVLWFASMAFGAIHAVAWHDYFPSEVEAWIWRLSALYVTFSGLVWLLVNMTARLSKRIDALWDRILALEESRAVIGFFSALCTFCGVLYIFARLFLVVEAFISVRKLAIAAYETPNWAQLIPHL